MSNHALAFKVLRLRPPELSIPDQAKFNFIEDVSAAAHFNDQPLGGGASVFADRIELTGQGQLGVSGALILPQNFGTVYLGQTLSIAVALCNQSNAAVHNVGIRVEIQSDHGKSILLDTMPTQGLATLAPGDHHEFIVKHDVRDLGPHTLLCASAYVTPAAPNEPRYSPQAFKFLVLNPLIVRTKHRGLGSSTVFLEATIENKTEDPMLLESVDLAVASGYTFEKITSEANNTARNSVGKNNMGPLGDYIASVPLLDPRGGASSYVFKLTRLWQQGQEQQNQSQKQAQSGTSSAKTSPRGGSTDHDGAALGKLDIKWTGAMGDLARLQTQIISGNPRPHRELRLEVIKFPDRIAVAEPFTLELSIVSGVDRRLGPAKVSYHPAYTMKSALSAPISGTAATTTMISTGLVGISSDAEEGIVLDGLQSECINEISPRGRAHLTLSMLPILPGRQFIQGLILTDERDGRVFDTLIPIEVYVEE